MASEMRVSCVLYASHACARGGVPPPPTPMCLFSNGTSLEHPGRSTGAERVLFFSRTVGATTRVGGSSRKEEPHGEEPSGWVSLWVSHGSRACGAGELPWS